jgi:hypothetical protein
MLSEKIIPELLVVLLFSKTEFETPPMATFPIKLNPQISAHSLDLKTDLLMELEMNELGKNIPPKIFSSNMEFSKFNSAKTHESNIALYKPIL